jgi:hypothetical protein
MLAMDATFTVFNAMKVIDDQKAKNTASTNIPLLKQTIELFNSKDRATIQNDYSILTDGTRIISDKLKAANEVNTIVNGYDKNKYAD